MLYFVIVHGVLFTGLYMYVNEYVTVEKEIEGFDETEDAFFQDISRKLDKIFSEKYINVGENDITIKYNDLEYIYIKESDCKSCEISDKTQYILDNWFVFKQKNYLL